MLSLWACPIRGHIWQQLATAGHSCGRSPQSGPYVKGFFRHGPCIGLCWAASRWQFHPLEPYLAYAQPLMGAPCSGRGSVAVGTFHQGAPVCLCLSLVWQAIGVRGRRFFREQRGCHLPRLPRALRCSLHAWQPRIGILHGVGAACSPSWADQVHPAPRFLCHLPFSPSPLLPFSPSSLSYPLLPFRSSSVYTHPPRSRIPFAWSPYSVKA